jgi:hypothetical protein
VLRSALRETATTTGPGGRTKRSVTTPSSRLRRQGREPGRESPLASLCGPFVPPALFRCHSHGQQVIVGLPEPILATLAGQQVLLNQRDLLQGTEARRVPLQILGSL